MYKTLLSLLDLITENYSHLTFNKPLPIINQIFLTTTEQKIDNRRRKQSNPSK